jgi:hypothetical protein
MMQYADSNFHYRFDNEQKGIFTLFKKSDLHNAGKVSIFASLIK